MVRVGAAQDAPAKSSKQKSWLASTRSRRVSAERRCRIMRSGEASEPWAKQEWGKETLLVDEWCKGTKAYLPVRTRPPMLGCRIG